MNKKRSLLRDFETIAAIEADNDASRRAVERARAAVLASSAVAPAPNAPLSRRKVMTLRNTIAVAAALVMIFVLAHWLAPHGTPGGLAFADVQAQVAKAKSVQYTEIRTNQTQDGRKLDGLVRRIKVLGAHRMREELTDIPANAGSVDELPVGKSHACDYVQIHDASTGKMLTLYPDKKAYRRVERILGIDADGNVVESKPEPRPLTDFYSRIRDVPDEKAVKLTDKFIGGKAATGFEIVEKHEHPTGTNTVTRRYWVDPLTKLPVQIEISLRSDRPGLAESDWVQKEIVFDQPLDETLFCTDPPEGYKDLAAEADNKESRPDE